MSEAISYISSAQLPVVFVNIVRGGPGLGGILPSQADYFQATKGGGHGDYRLLVMAPASVQEAVEMVMKAFPLATSDPNPAIRMTGRQTVWILAKAASQIWSNLYF
jgi:2-oxoglutarate ferredoxin oxidoreductase subunit alpha